MPTKTVNIIDRIASTYTGDDIEHTSAIAEEVGKAITAKANASIMSSAEVGALLRAVRDSGLAVASTGGTSHKRDARASAVSDYMSTYAPSVDPKRYAEWLQEADSLVVLAGKGIDGGTLSTSVHRLKTKAVTSAQWANAVRKATKAADAKATDDTPAKAPTAAMVREALTGKVAKSGKAETTVEGDPIRKAIAALVAELNTADDAALTDDDNVRAMEALHATLGDIIA